MEVKTKKSFNDLITSLTEEVIEEEELDEITTTDNIAGYDSPLAFGDTSRASKKKKKKISTNSTGYDMVNEDLILFLFDVVICSTKLKCDSVFSIGDILLYSNNLYIDAYAE